MSMTTQSAADGDAVGLGRGGRISRQRKRDAVLRLLQGEDLETVSRARGDGDDLEFLAGCLPGWR